ncbi:MAG: hypothetical protein JSS65_04100, partial [Armatimonadetes bacterium]|nr:hypothetical protein [Armatimonadota bacterium]
FCGVFMVAIVAAGVTNRAIGGRVLNGTQMSSIFDSLRPVSQTNTQVPNRFGVQLLADAPVVTVPVGMAMVDGRAGGYNGKAVESLTFRDKEGLLSLLMVGGLEKVEGIEPSPFGDKYSTGFFNGRMCATWKQGPYTILLMGDRSAEELKALARRLVPEDEGAARR